MPIQWKKIEGAFSNAKKSLNKISKYPKYVINDIKFKMYKKEILKLSLDNEYVQNLHSLYDLSEVLSPEELVEKFKFHDTFPPSSNEIAACIFVRAVAYWLGQLNATLCGEYAKIIENNNLYREDLLSLLNAYNNSNNKTTKLEIRTETLKMLNSAPYSKQKLQKSLKIIHYITKNKSKMAKELSDLCRIFGNKEKYSEQLFHELFEKLSEAEDQCMGTSNSIDELEKRIQYLLDQVNKIEENLKQCQVNLKKQ